MALEWELLEDEGENPVVSERAKVPGGWLVRFYQFEYQDEREDYTFGYGFGGMTFYPDPSHSWDGNSL